MPMPWRLDIEELGPKADGIHRGEQGTVYVDRTVPGDVVDARLWSDAAGVVRGDVLSLVEASPHRRPAPCPHYDCCGNCTLQHVTEDYYRAWKRQLVHDALERQRLRPQRWLDPVFLEAGNRRRATFAAYRRRREVVLGYYRRRSKAIAPIDRCLVAHPSLLAARDSLRPYLPHVLVDGGPPVDVFLQLVGDAVDVAITGPVGRHGHPDGGVGRAAEAIVRLTPAARLSWRLDERSPFAILSERDSGESLAVMFAALRVLLPPAAFLQPTEAGQRALTRAVLDALPETGRFADLFSGCGTFAGPMLERGPVDAYESVPEAVAALRAARSGGKLRAFRRDLFRNPLGKELGQYDAVVLDPPRCGAVEQASALARSKVPRVVAVSCNPATFARDARWLVGGGYRLDSVQLIDQFVGSHHVELVGVFSRA
jgi:23S rRNA (uracil1939-C5)-methyltransferase